MASWKKKKMMTSRWMLGRLIIRLGREGNRVKRASDGGLSY
jgi:hypothetical protein